MPGRFEYAQAEEIRDAFARHGVRYLFLVKSRAILLGYPDTTQDADLFVDKSPANGGAVVVALRELGFTLSDEQASEVSRGKDFVQIKSGPFDIDLIFAPDGIEARGCGSARDTSRARQEMLCGRPEEFMDALFSAAIIPYLLRWAHVVFGIIWLGHLYFFNLVNVPFQGGLDKELKPKVNPALLLRAFYWFRWGAMYTLIFGLALFVWYYIAPEHNMRDQAGVMTGRAIWIQLAMLLGIIMWFNVWFVIWPRQKKILGGMAAGTPHPDAAKMAAVAGKASRFNTYASGPMLFGMVAPAHFGAISFPVLLVVSIIGCGFWFGMIKRSFKVKTSV